MSSQPHDNSHPLTSEDDEDKEEEQLLLELVDEEYEEEGHDRLRRHGWQIFSADELSLHMIGLQN